MWLGLSLWRAQKWVVSTTSDSSKNWIKKAECQRTDAFELWCWRRFLRFPWTAKRANHSILKEINPEYALEGQMLKLQYFGHLMRRSNSLEKTLMLGKIDGWSRRGWQKMRRLDGLTNSMHKLQEIVKDREAWRAAVHRVAKSWTWLSDSTTTTKTGLKARILPGCCKHTGKA